MEVYLIFIIKSRAEFKKIIFLYLNDLISIHKLQSLIEVDVLLSE